MLDQKTIAGIGNLYASEILHVSRVHPETRCQQLTRAQIKRIAENTKAILHEAIRYEGSTLSDGTYRNALNKSGVSKSTSRVCQRGKTLLLLRERDSSADCSSTEIDLLLPAVSVKTSKEVLIA